MSKQTFAVDGVQMTRQEILHLPIEKRREILEEQSRQLMQEGGMNETPCAVCGEVGCTDEQFETWAQTLETDVIQQEYGYKPNEFAFYKEQWRPYYDAGLTPSDAFKKALAA